MTDRPDRPDYCHRCKRHLTRAEQIEHWCISCNAVPACRPQVDRGTARPDVGQGETA
jgi:hypothetical protein